MTKTPINRPEVECDHAYHCTAAKKCVHGKKHYWKDACDDECECYYCNEVIDGCVGSEKEE